MYFDQLVIVKSPVILPHLKVLLDRLCAVIGDSSLINNISLLYAQGYIYSMEEDIRVVAGGFGDHVSNDMLFPYQSILAIPTPDARECLKNDVFDFIIQASTFFKNDYTLNNIMQQAAQQNCYLSVNRVMDDATPPYLEASIKRRT